MGIGAGHQGAGDTYPRGSFSTVPVDERQHPDPRDSARYTQSRVNGGTGCLLASWSNETTITKKGRCNLQSTLTSHPQYSPLFISTHPSRQCRFQSNERSTHQSPPATSHSLLRQPTRRIPSLVFTTHSLAHDLHTLLMPRTEHHLLFPPVVRFNFCIHRLLDSRQYLGRNGRRERTFCRSRSAEREAILDLYSVSSKVPCA